MRSHARVAVAGAALLALSGCGFSIGIGDYPHETSDDARVTGTVNAIEVGGDARRVTIRSGSDGEVRIHRVIGYRGHRPRPSQRVSGGVLTFSQNCSQCAISYDLTVPASVRVKVHNDSGAIDIEGVAAADAETSSGRIEVRRIKGDVRADTDSGGVDADDIGGVFNAHTASGGIRATALRSTRARADCDSGSIRLQFATAPADVNAQTDSGGLHVEVPDGTYRVDAGADSGQTDINVRQDPNATARLYLRTDSGNISVDPA